MTPEEFLDRCRKALSADDLKELFAINCLYNDIDPSLLEKLQAHDENETEINKVKQRLERWKKELKEGDYCDVYVKSESKWFETRVVAKDDDKNTILVHYLGWQKSLMQRFS